MDTEKFVKINEKLNQLDGKYYQVVYNESTSKVEKNCVSYNEKVPELLIMLTMNILEYTACCAQFTLSPSEINNEYLKMVGILFSKNNKTEYSLDLINVNGTNNMEIHLTTYNDKGNVTNLLLVKKVEVFPGNKEIINYMLELLSDDKVKKIFDY